MTARPCPFYQQGRCYFEASCNFLHTVSVKCPTTTICSQNTQSQIPPLVTVDSPHAVLSPPRSPRLNDLLHALKDVIGEDPDCSYDYEETTYIEEPVKETSDYNNTVIEIDHSLSNAKESFLESCESNLTLAKDETLRLPLPSSEPWHAIQTSVNSIVPDVHPLSSPLLSPDDIKTLPDDDAELNGDSDTDSGSLHTLKPNPRSSLGSLNSVFFGVLSSPIVTPSSHVLPSRISGFITRSFQSPIAPAPFEQDDVLSNTSLDSPADLSFIHDEPEPVPSEQYVIVGPEIEVVHDIAGEPIDEQMAEIYLESEAITSTSEDEYDGDDSADDSEAGHCSQEDTTSICVGIPPVTPEEVHNAFRQAIKTPVHYLADDVDFAESEAIANPPLHLTDSDDIVSSTSHTWEVHNVFEKEIQKPVHFLVDNAKFVEGETIGNSSLQLSDPDDIASSTSHDSESPNFSAAMTERQLKAKSILDSSPVVQDLEDCDIETDRKSRLAYLRSPPNENDILHTLYDQYYDLPEEESKENLSKAHVKGPQVKDNESPVMESPILVTPLDDPHLNAAEVESSSGLTPVRSGFLRESVFTPPSTISATRGRSGTVIALDSSRSGSTHTVTCFLSQQARSSSEYTGSPESIVPEVQEVIVSKKVPFGFRKSFGQSGTTAFSSQRSSMTIRPPPASAPNVIRTSQSRESISPNNAPVNGLRPLRLVICIASLSHRQVYHQVALILAIPCVRNTPFTTEDIPSPLSSIHLRRLTTFESAVYGSPRSTPLSRPLSWQSNPVADLGDQNEPRFTPSRRAFETSCLYKDVEDEQDDFVQDDEPAHFTRRNSIADHGASILVPRTSALRPPLHAVPVPKPALMFAIASDDVKQVRRVLENGDADPNDFVGPQSALAFTLTNEQLANRIEIAKTLLAYGADPKAIMQPTSKDVSDSHSSNEGRSSEGMSPHPSLVDTLDPATRYYVERANAPNTRKTSVLVQCSDFHPLTRVRYELIGQDRALEQLFKDLSIHSRQLSVTPIVILLCGPSGHGKSFLARKFDADLPQEIEKTHGEPPLWALLMPWEHGRCTFEANGRLVDTRNVIWLGTSNIGQDLVFEHHNARALPHGQMSKGEYTELMTMLRPRVSERLGASILSRVTSVLPFVPFTLEEREAICYEALLTIAGDIIQTFSTDVLDAMVKGALANYTVTEAAIATVLSLIVAAVLLAKVLPNILAEKVIVEKEDRSCPVDRVDLTDISIYTGKPEKVVLAPRSFDEPAGWVPQIRAYPPNLPLPEPIASPKNKKSPKLSVTNPDIPQLPSPNYLMANQALVENQTSHPIPRSPAILTPCTPSPTSPANRCSEKNPNSLAEGSVQLVSPRSESFILQNLVCPKEPSSPNSGEPILNLPRLMAVSASFTPTLDDELAIKIGDIVRMLEEFQDGWCLIQRVGRIDAPKGAVPRFCLQERRGVAPIAPSRKYSTGSLKSARPEISK
ncbi:hypothetical protein C0992_002996 [Termitomyces sp. T32_za158]|nr:hypothetical protein C0992_002996 [Termitomyces sp. T32_za158]